MQLFINTVLGEKFTVSSMLDLNAAFNESTSCDPLLFILTSAYDPLPAIKRLAAKNQIDSENVKFFSMGQYRGAIELAAIEAAIKSGHWVILQNCHLANDWMPVLERVCDNLTSDTTHAEFRLWITTKSTPTFPLSILHRCIKLIDEPLQHTRGILLNAFTNPPIVNETWIDSCKAPLELKRQLYVLSVLHGIIIERRSYDCIGWNYPYRFGCTDFHIGVNQLVELVDSFDSMPYDMLQMMMVECIYGSHMVDVYDLRCLERFSKYFFDGSDVQSISAMDLRSLFPLNYKSIESITNFIKGLDAGTLLCGLHANLIGIRDRNECRFIANSFVGDEVR